MKINEGRAALRFALILSAINITVFLLYYLSSYVADSTAMAYVTQYFSELASRLMPIAGAAALTVAYTERGMKLSFLRAILYTLPLLLNAFPYYAFEYAYAGYTIDDVLLLAALESLITLILGYCEIVFLFLVMIFATRFFAKKKKRRAAEFSSDLSIKRAFDLSIPEVSGVMVAAFVTFAVALVPEIVDTVNFILDVAGTYRVGEIFYIAFKYVFILAILLFSQITVFATRKLFHKCKYDPTVME